MISYCRFGTFNVNVANGHRGQAVGRGLWPVVLGIQVCLLNALLEPQAGWSQVKQDAPAIEFPVIAASAPQLPTSTPLLPSKDLSVFRLSGPATNKVHLEVMTVKGQAFSRALRVRTKEPAAHSRDVFLAASTAAPVEKGDVLLATFWVRCAESSAETVDATVHFIFESTAPPYEQSIGSVWSYDLPSLLRVGPTWTKVQLPFVSAGAYKAGEARIRFDVGFAPQVLEIAGVSVNNFGKGIAPEALPRTHRSSYAGRATDAPWRETARRRIEQIRKADLKVAVVDAQGKPLAGAKVRVRMRRHAFGFGSAVQANLLVKDSENARIYRETILRLFNKVVFENDLKWPQWEQMGKRETTLRALHWLRTHGLEVRGHVLVWPSWKFMPKDVFGLRLRNNLAAMRSRIRDRIGDAVGPLRGQLVEWDVINEPYTHNDAMDILGPEVMVDWFKEARQTDPGAKLFINDFGILEYGGADTAHQLHYERTIRYLLERSAPIDGIGLQGHFGATLTEPEELLKILNRFARFGKSLQVTEFSLSLDDEKLQADYTRDLMTVLFSHPSVSGFVMWGFWEGRHWRRPAAMFRKDWSIKPNGQIYTNLVFKEWWTDVAGETDYKGEYKTRGFLGDYEVTVVAGGKSQTVGTSLKREGTNIKAILGLGTRGGSQVD